MGYTILARLGENDRELLSSESDYKLQTNDITKITESLSDSMISLTKAL